MVERHDGSKRQRIWRMPKDMGEGFDPDTDLVTCKLLRRPHRLNQSDRFCDDPKLVSPKTAREATHE